MASSRAGWRCVRCVAQAENALVQPWSRARQFSTTAFRPEEVIQQQQPQDSLPPPPPARAQAKGKLDPNTVSTPRLERKLVREQHVLPIGSRRRRAALRRAREIPFEQLPYQCFQEARKILAADRMEKLEQIEIQRARLQKAKAQQVEPQHERWKERRVISLEKHLEELKVFADVNDPIVKRIFEDGKGDLNKPVYRHLAEKKWQSYDKKVNVQRIEQFNLVPDIVAALEPVVATDLAFDGRKIEPGQYIDSTVSEAAPNVNIQSFQKGERLVTIACVNPDIPNVARDNFDYRCHFLASNVKITPTSPLVQLAKLSRDSQTILPWMPAYTQKGAPYQRMAFIILEQPENTPIDTTSASVKVKRDGFILRSFIDRHRLFPIGANLFRSQWDEATAGVMKRLGVPGHDVEFKRMKVEPLPYKKLPGNRYR
ncbi:PEBP-like protein [Myriangium duriaei CBS 260.36]|uniref:Large ribosomal subunit protein mL38 n=1 Tax=Myriangium duriaei CBS 260.36 TaxID=1168546 RepID=A0A9P4IRP9_9PEZI|nr:PEBP-like protein [Myriangium duriaei CBS 260.36]